MKGKLVVGLLAGGIVGATAAIMSVPGYRSMVMRKAKGQKRRLMRMAKHVLPF